MANLTHFDPFRRVAAYDPLPIPRTMREMLQGLDRFFTEPEWFGNANWPTMRLDVAENETDYVVKADIPGVKKEDIKIDIEGHTVTINAELKENREKREGETVMQSERLQGNIFRRFTLPREIDEEGAAASYQDGVLELTLPKKEGDQVKHLTVM